MNLEAGYAPGNRLQKGGRQFLEFDEASLRGYIVRNYECPSHCEPESCHRGIAENL